MPFSSLSGKYISYTSCMQNFKFLASLCSCVDWFEPHMIPNPEDRFSRVEAQRLTTPLLHISGMATVDTAPPPALGLQDPTAGHTELLTDPNPNPAQAPDGRLSGPSDMETPTPAKGDTNKDTLDKESNQTITPEVSKTDTKDKPRVTELRILEPDKDKKSEETPEHVVDIVKQSKLQETHRSGSDFGELPEFPQSRPLTETSFRDGTKVSIDIPKEKRDTKIESDKDGKTPFSVKVERKPLHTAQTRSHSDYFSKTPSTSRYTYIAASLSQFTGFQPDFKGNESFFQQLPDPQMRAARRPPKLVRLATVTMTPK